MGSLLHLLRPPRGAVQYQYKDEFLTDDAAPLTSPRTCEPGPGTLTSVQSDGEFSISGGNLVVPAQATPAFADLTCFYTDAVARADRLGFFADIKITDSSISKYVLIGTNDVVSGDASPGKDMLFFRGPGDGPDIRRDGATRENDIAFPPVLDRDYRMVIIPRSAGAYYVFEGGEYTKTTLGFVSDVDTTANLFGGVVGWTSPITVSNMGFVDMGQFSTAYQSDNGLANSVTASPANPTTVTPSNGDDPFEITWTVATGETLTILFRRTDDDNCWKLVCDQAGGTIKLYKREGGSDTEVDAGKTQTWTNTTSYRIFVNQMGSSIKTYVGTTKKHDYAGDGYNQSVAGVKVSGHAAASDLIVWTRYPSSLSISPNIRPRGLISTMGDSKSLSTWQPEFMANTNYNDALPVNTGGETVALLAASVVADLAANPSNAVDYVCINLGANDMSGALVEGTWKADYQTILDTVNQRFPSAQIYLMRPWRRSYTTSPDTLAGWIADLVTTNSAFCNLGPDERVFIENGDNGVTYTDDGLHPNAAGYTLTAQQWQSTLGI